MPGMGITLGGGAGVPGGFLTSVHLSTSTPTLGKQDVCYLERPREPLPLKGPQGLEALVHLPPLGLAPTHPPIHSASVLGLHLEGAIPQGAWGLGRAWGPLGQRLGGHRDPEDEPFHSPRPGGLSPGADLTVSTCTVPASASLSQEETHTDTASLSQRTGPGGERRTSQDCPANPNAGAGARPTGHRRGGPSSAQTPRGQHARGQHAASTSARNRLAGECI